MDAYPQPLVSERKKASNDRIGPIIARFTESMLSVHPDQ